MGTITSAATRSNGLRVSATAPSGYVDLYAQNSTRAMQPPALNAPVNAVISVYQGSPEQEQAKNSLPPMYRTPLAKAQTTSEPRIIVLEALPDYDAFGRV
jgi:hypothetical protein